MFGTFLFFGFVVIVVFVCGMFAGAKIENDHWKQQALKRGHGEFCSQTKAWKWK